MFVFKPVNFEEAERIRLQAQRDRARFIGGSLVKAIRSVGRGIGAIAEAFAEAKRMQAMHEELARMSDRELRDMGITRADIPAVVLGTLTRESDRREPAPTAVPERSLEPVAATDERLAA